MDWRTILKDLAPPMVLRAVRRLLPRTTPGPLTVPGPEWCTVAAGPGAGVRLLLDTARPAFRDMQRGTYDAWLWPALDGLEPADGARVLDIGAHVGYHSLAFAQRFPDARVVAFEPNPANFARLQQHLAENPGLAARIEPVPVALGHLNGELEMDLNDRVDDESSSGGHLVAGSAPLPTAVYRAAGYRRARVPVRRLDDLAHERGWVDAPLWKIDVEGAEHLVLEGARTLLAKCRPLLFIEVHGAGCMFRTMTLLADLHYQVELLHEEGPRRGFVRARPR